MTKQKTVYTRGKEDEYRFLATGVDKTGSLEWHIANGWLLKFRIATIDNVHVYVFERTQVPEKEGPWSR